MTLNRGINLGFSVVLLIAGVLGFILPASGALLSGAFWYNIFHLTFGVLGLGFFFLGTDFHSRWFNRGFGLLDLYQGMAYFGNWFPGSLFQWTPGDTILHFILGSGLILVSWVRNRP